MTSSNPNSTPAPRPIATEFWEVSFQHMKTEGVNVQPTAESLWKWTDILKWI